MINPKIFKAYDVRGIYPDEINEEAAYKIGRSFVSFLNKKNPRLVIGRDGRKSSPLIFESFKKGLLDSGAEISNIGLCNTPLLGFSVAKFGYDGGAIITASHNPPQFNGIKFDKEKALRVHGDEIQEIKEIAERGDFIEEKGKEEKKDFLQDYLKHILSFTKDLKDLKVVIDCGNGVGSITAKPLFSKLNLDSIFLYDEIDGSFPNHLPDPHDKESLDLIQKKILETGADIGAIFDGDADRCILVDEKGNLISTDTLLSLFATEELKTHPGEDIYYDLRFSMATAEEIKKAGGNPIMMRVGNPFYKEKIIKEGGLLGAELSGHIMFRDNFGIDDGLFVLIKTLNILHQKKEKISVLLSPFKRYFQTEEINLEVKSKKESLDRVREFFKDGEEIDLDGVYIKYEKWWFNLRQSNTEDVVRLRIEAETEDLLKEKREKLISLVKAD